MKRKIFQVLGFVGVLTLFVYYAFGAVGPTQKVTFGFDPPYTLTPSIFGGFLTNGIVPDGYYVRWGTSTNLTGAPIDIGTNRLFALTGLPVGSNLYFAVSGYRNTGATGKIEGPKSNIQKIPLPTNDVIIVTWQGSYYVEIQGVAGRAYAIEASTNLQGGPWMDVFTTPVLTNTEVIGYKLTNSSLPANFYRHHFLN